MRNSSANNGGFTLVEMVIAIVITGIIAGMVAVFVTKPVKGYVDTAARADLADAADTALKRMKRDLRLALPNSVRVDASGHYLELLLTSMGGRYLAAEDNPSSGHILDFSNSADTSFDVIGPDLPSVGESIVVYNLGPGLPPADAYCSGSACNNRATVASVSGNTVTLSANPFALEMPELPSPGHRFMAVSTPVTYGCSNGNLIRYWNYSISPAQPVPPSGGSSALLATGVANCVFSYSSMANIRSGLVGIGLTLANPDNADAGSVILFEQVHVDNTP
jgi:MSHA biogenesis protein MshO